MKKVVGITAEYNPFHFGHLYQLSEIRRLLGEDCAIAAALSGDFVQRGEPALFSKFARAEAAVRSGVDLALELPVQWSCASAGYFAKGAVSLLSSLGITHLAFGSESGNLEALQNAARVLSEPGFEEHVKTLMKASPSLSYPAAREAALRNCCGEESASVLASPNDTLAVEYLIALRQAEKETGKKIEPLCIRRAGPSHDAPEILFAGNSAECHGMPFASASAIRNALRLSKESPSALLAVLKEFVPREAFSVYSREIRQERGPVFSDSLEREMLSRLIMFVKPYYSSLPDASEGIGNRLYEAVREKNTLDEIVTFAKTKRFSESRVRRLVLQACLGISGRSFGPRLTESLPPYLRPLAMNEKGRLLLAEAGETSPIPVLSKAADVRLLGPDAETVFSCGVHAHDLYELAFLPSESVKRGNDFRFSPVFVQNNE